MSSIRSAPLLEASGLVVGYGGRSVLDPLDVTIEEGRLVCLLGANGSGKSTLLRTISGLQEPLAGVVNLMQRPLHRLTGRERARLLALVLTDRVTAPSMRGYDLVALGRQPYTGWSGMLAVPDHEAVEGALVDTGSQLLAERLVAELSDGERQRLLVARALAQEPRVLVLDEPTAFLDLPRRVELMHLLRGLARRRRLAVLLSTHDLELALRYADEVWLLDQQGTVNIGAPEDLVLSGQFEKAFHRQGLVFDVERGTLRVAEDSRGTVAIGALGRVGHWLQHAVRREGFDVTDTASVRVEHTGTGFRIMADGRVVTETDSVRSLVAALVKGQQA